MADNVAVVQGENAAAAMFCSSASLPPVVFPKAFTASGAVVGPVTGPRGTNAFMIVCLGISIDFVFLRWLIEDLGRERGFGTGAVG